MLAHASHWSQAPTTISPHVAENIDRVLRAVRTLLHMDVAFVSEFLGQNRIFHGVDSDRGDAALKANDVIPLASGYCRLVVNGALPQLIPDTSKLPLARSIPETYSIPIGAHLSVPINLEDGRVFGTFCCFSHRPQPELGERDIALLRTFGRVLATAIEADVRDDTERRVSLGRIQSAIESGDPQIVFQPIRNLSNRTLIGVECLARFAALPYRSPDRWFAEAHAVAVGGELELLAARKALLACALLPEPLTASINISPDTLIAAPLRRRWPGSTRDGS